MSTVTSTGDTAGDIKNYYFKAFEVLGSAPPITSEQAQAFAERAVDRAKTKAELMAKAIPAAFPHTQMLEWTARIVGFPDGWHGLSSYAKKFPKLTADERAGDLRSVWLCIACWVLTDELTEKYPLAEQIVEDLKEFFTKALGEADAAEIVLRRMFFKGVKDSGDGGFTTEELTYLFGENLNWEPHTYLSSLLSRVPVKNGRASWPSLDKLKVADLLALPLANVDVEDGYGYPAWEHLTVSLVSQLALWAKLRDANKSYLSSRPAGNENLVKAQTIATRMRCREVLEQQLRPVLKKSVLEVVTRTEDANGFFTNVFSGTPEEIEDTLKDNFLDGHLTVKRIVFREPFGDSHTLSIFRNRFPMSEIDGAACYNAEAVIHNQTDELVAKVGLVLTILPRDYSLQALVSLLDETNDNDVQELAGTVVDAVLDDMAFPFEEWRRLLLVRDWEVRKADRGTGLGVRLLAAACKKAFKGLPGPRAVAAKVWPMQLQPTLADAAEGIPEIGGPKERLLDYWQTHVLDSAGVLPKTVDAAVLARRYPFMHTSLSEFELYMHGINRARAREYDES